MGKALVGTRDGTGTGLATGSYAHAPVLTTGQESAIRDALDASRAGSTTRVYGSAWTRFVLMGRCSGLRSAPHRPRDRGRLPSGPRRVRTFPRFRPSGPRRHPYRAH